MIDSRWRLSIHEAAHAATAIALGGSVTSLVLGATRGECLNSELSLFESATVAAAGPESELLFLDCAPPSLPPVEPSGEQADNIAVADERIDGPFCGVPTFRISDHEHVAMWAIRDHEDDPAKWPGRVYFIRNLARNIVIDNGSLVLEIATALYSRSVLNSTDIDALLKRKVA